MKIKGKVSLWLGDFKNEEELGMYTKIEYMENGDSIPSQFEKDFSLGYYDRDLVEKDWISSPTGNIKELLIDFSYDNQLIQQFEKNELRKEYNTIILIYNFSYGFKKENATYKDNKLNFIGVAEYED